MKFFILIVTLIGLIENGYSIILNDCVCGQQSDEGLIIIKTSGSRIVNGTEVRPHKYPWMAVMMKGWHNICGGSIISDKNILTAGHCVYYIPSPRKTRWIVGTHNVKKSNKDKFNTYKTHDYRIHPYFRSGDLFDTYDIAVIIVERPIIFGPAVKPICLPGIGEDQLFWNQKVTVAGWGRISENGPPANILQETKVWLKSSPQCLKMASDIAYDTKSMVCAHEQYTDACQGDSGGPLFGDKSTNHNVLIGVVSFGDGCARDFPGIYSKVPEALTLSWIKSVIANSNGNICMDPAARRDILKSYN